LWQANPTVCNTTIGAVKREYEKIQELRRLVMQLTRMERDTQTKKKVFSI
jgi:hypothetical protein